MKIRLYNKDKDEEKLIRLLIDEGEEWSCYWADDVCEKYKAALKNSITYVACVGENICGYSRSVDDCGLYIYVCDLLVSSKYRGASIGRKLMECIYKDYPDRAVYVMSDADEYYKKLQYELKGSIYEVTNSLKK